MKTTNIFIIILFFATVFLSCDKQEENPPVIRYIRYLSDPVTNLPAPVPVEGASAGRYIAIIGNNLVTTRDILCDNYTAKFYSTYATDTCVIAMLPVSDKIDFAKGIPKTITVVTEYGIAVKNFTVMPAPAHISGIYPDFAPAGTDVYIFGSYFFEVSDVFFKTDNNLEVKATVKSFNSDSILVTIPEGVRTGVPRVVAAGGENSTSDARFYEQKDVFVVYDLDFKKGTNIGGYNTKNMPSTNIPQNSGMPGFITGGYKYCDFLVGAGKSWQIRFDFDFNTMLTDLNGNEIKVSDIYKGAGDPLNQTVLLIDCFNASENIISDLRIIFNIDKTDPLVNKYYDISNVVPGKWITYRIPLKNFSLSLADLPKLRRLTIAPQRSGPSVDTQVKFAFDNIRFATR